MCWGVSKDHSVVGEKTVVGLVGFKTSKILFFSPLLTLLRRMENKTYSLINVGPQ